MKETKGGLMSFNNFLSTSRDHAVSLAFAESNKDDPDLVGILFVLTVDPSKSTTPFASINGITYFSEEDEVLFSMHTIHRIHDIKSVGEIQRLFQVDLILSSENDDKDLRILTGYIREETFSSSEGWYRLGLVLHKLGHAEKAEQIYQILLDQATNESEKALIYQYLGLTKVNQGEYKEAITCHQNLLELQRQLVPPNHPSLAFSYTNIGVVYRNTGRVTDWGDGGYFPAKN